MCFIKHHKFMKKKDDIVDSLTMLRREGDLDQLARWRSGALIDGNMVDCRGIVDLHDAEGSGQEVLVCGGEGGGGFFGGWRGRWCRVGGVGGVNGDRNDTQKRKRWVLIRECL